MECATSESLLTVHWWNRALQNVDYKTQDKTSNPNGFCSMYHKFLRSMFGSPQMRGRALGEEPVSVATTNLDELIMILIFIIRIFPMT